MPGDARPSGRPSCWRALGCRPPATGWPASCRAGCGRSSASSLPSCTGPDLLILDEPSTGVDPVSRSGLWSLIASAAGGRRGSDPRDDVPRRCAASEHGARARRRPSARRRFAEQIVAAMPGTVVGAAARPAGQAGLRAWRRGASWRVWCPPGTSYPGERVRRTCRMPSRSRRSPTRRPGPGADEPGPADQADGAELPERPELAERAAGADAGRERRRQLRLRRGHRRSRGQHPGAPRRDRRPARRERRRQDDTHPHAARPDPADDGPDPAAGGAAQPGRPGAGSATSRRVSACTTTSPSRRTWSSPRPSSALARLTSGWPAGRVGARPGRQTRRPS